MILHGECAKLAGSEQNRWSGNLNLHQRTSNFACFIKLKISEIFCKSNSIHFNLKVSINDVQEELSEVPTNEGLVQIKTLPFLTKLLSQPVDQNQNQSNQKTCKQSFMAFFSVETPTSEDHTARGRCSVQYSFI